MKNNGLETETGTYWVFHNNDYLFRLVYNKGGDGTGSSYILNSNNKLEEHLSYAFNSFYMIVGLITPNGGRIFLDDREITKEPAMFHILGFLFIIIIAILLIGLSIIGTVIRNIFGLGGRRTSSNSGLGRIFDC